MRESALADHGLERPCWDLILPVVRGQIDHPHFPAVFAAVTSMATSIMPKQAESVFRDYL